MTVHRLVVAAFLCVFGLAPPVFAEDFVDILTAARAGTQVPAMAMVVMRDGEVADKAVQGLRRQDAAEPARAGDVWHIGSNGKAFTATLIAKLVEQQTLSWETPLSTLLPDLTAQMRPEYRTVTLLQLLTHRGGLEHDSSDWKLFEALYTDSRSLPEQRMAYIARALQEPPAVRPGARPSYSNSGFIIAAAIAERATGSSYEDLLRLYVFDPLGMKSAQFGVTHGDKPLGHRDGKPVLASSSGQPQFAPPDGQQGNPLFYAPAGNMYLTMDDWAAYCLDQMKGANGQGKLLKTESYRLIQSPQGKSGMALGWAFQDSMRGHVGPVLMHTGSDGTWFAIATLFPQTQSGVLIVANAGKSMGGEKAVMKAFKAVRPTVSPLRASGLSD